MKQVLSTEAMRTINAAGSNQGISSDRNGCSRKEIGDDEKITSPINPQQRVWIVVDEDWW